MSFLFCFCQNLSVFLVIEPFKQFIKIVYFYRLCSPIHSSVQHSVVYAAKNFYRVAGAIGVYLTTLNQSEHSFIPSGKANTE